MELNKSQLIENLNHIQQNIQSACQKAGRDPKEVQLLAVSKTKKVEDIRILYEQGQIMYGENYVQELCEKQSRMDEDIQWHFIGHLQRNKVKDVIGKTVLIHSVDSIRLAREIEKEAKKKQITVNILLEVNIAGEPTKYGFLEEEIIDAVNIISTFAHIRIQGLMTSAPKTEDPEHNRIYFHKMKQLLQTINALQLPDVNMTILSMGMTNDYEVAIEEGASIVRIGTALFGERSYTGKQF